MDAIILAGGRGTRLQSCVSDRPKTMAIVGGRPFLALLLDHLASWNFRRVILSVGFRKDAIVSYFGDRYHTLDITYAIEDEPLGTGGAIANALKHTSDDDVWALNGDTFVELDFARMRREHARRRHAVVTMALWETVDTSRFSQVSIAGARVVEMRTIGSRGPGLINAGTYLINPGRLQSYKVPRIFSLEQELFPEAARRGDLSGFITTGRFIDIGVPEDYGRAQLLLGMVDAHGTSP